MNSVISLEAHRSTEPSVTECVRARARRYALWLRHLWAQGAVSAEQGLAITHGEVDRLLRNPTQLALEEEAFYATDAPARALAPEIARADQRLAQDREWLSWCRCFALSSAEADLLAVALAADLDPGLRRVYAYLHDEVSATHATPWLAARIFQWPSGACVSPDANLVRLRLARPLESSPEPWSALSSWAIDAAPLASFGTNTWRDPLLGPCVDWITPTDLEGRPSLQPQALAELRKAFEAERAPRRTAVEIDIVGSPGSGRSTLAAQAVAQLERDLLPVDASVALAPLSPELATDCLIRVLRLARATGAVPFFRHADSVSMAVWRAAQGLSDILLFGREVPSRESGTRDVNRLAVTLTPLSVSGREALWRTIRDESPPALIHERRLTASEVVQVARVAEGGPIAMRQVVSELLRPPGDLLQPLACPHTWEDLVLPPHVRERLQEFEQQAQRRWSVYEEWGFGRLCPLGRGITALFAGPSGTGKTMSAQVIARSLGLDLYRVDLSGVVNKYIGETEKKLKQVFDLCERANVLLFFDEADALFGQRTQVKDAHDRFANIEIDYLLQRMEQFDGVAVLATNRSNDLDPAFLRRLRFSIDFHAPGPIERLALWKRALLPVSPTGEPLLEAIDWAFLAEKLNLTGAGIKAAALSAAFLAHAQSRRIGMPHVIAAARRELTKHGTPLRATAFDEVNHG